MSEIMHLSRSMERAILDALPPVRTIAVVPSTVNLPANAAKLHSHIWKYGPSYLLQLHG